MKISDLVRFLDEPFASPLMKIGVSPSPFSKISSIKIVRVARVSAKISSCPAVGKYIQKWTDSRRPGILTLQGRMAGVVVGRMEMKGSKDDGQMAMVPPLARDFSKGSDSSYRSSEFRWKEIFGGKNFEIAGKSH